MARIDDDIEIGGKEFNPVRFRLSGNEEASRQMMGFGRRILGDLKRQMQLGELTQLSTRPLRLDNGAIIQAHSRFGEDGMPDMDEVWIFSPGVAANGQDICTGFIVRITTDNQDFLVLNVKEPAQEKGINVLFWTDTAWSGGTFYDVNSNEITQYYGFEEQLDWLYDELIIPGEGEIGYRTNEEGPDSNPIIPGVSIVFPGTLTLSVVLNQVTRFFTESWVGDYPGPRIADVDLYTAAWKECYSEANGYTFSTPYDNALDYNYNIAAQGTFVQEDILIKGIAPTIICQDTENPVSRYYGTDYERKDGVIVVKGINSNTEKNSFAVVWDGVATYSLEDELKKLVIETIEINDMDVNTGFIGGSGFMNWTGPEGYDWLYVKYGIPLNTGVGGAGIRTQEYTTTMTYDFQQWEMKTDVKSGDYEIEILCNANNDSHDVKIDILLQGTEHNANYTYSDVVVNGKSNKKAIISVKEQKPYAIGDKNPFVSIVNNK